MRTELRQIQRRLQVTTVFVTHDQVEALSMSNRIAVMRDGVIVQEGVPREIYRRPNSAFVAKFIGASTFIPGVVRRVDRAADGVVTIVAQTIIGEIVGRGSDGLSANQDVVVAVRPEGVRLRSAGEPSGANIFEGVVDVSLYVGDSMLYRIDIAGQPIQAKADPDTEFAPHESLTVELPPQACVVVAADPTLDKAAGGNVDGGPGLPMPTAVSGTGAPLDVQ
jgi:iron(III) transport system ATP-binding protein